MRFREWGRCMKGLDMDDEERDGGGIKRIVIGRGSE